MAILCAFICKLLYCFLARLPTAFNLSSGIMFILLGPRILSLTKYSGVTEIQIDDPLFFRHKRFIILGVVYDI